MKKCRFCAEEIQDEAMVCKHCGRELTPTSSLSRPVRGRLLLGLLALGVGVVGLLIGGNGAAVGFVLVWVGLGLSIPGSAVMRWGGGLIAAFLVTVLVMSSGGGLPLADELTMAKFNALETGMSYAEVQKVLVRPGKEISRAELAGTVTVMYQWDTTFGVGNMNAMFQNGKLVTKAQFGLK